MARYIKVNPKVASFLRLENDRLQVKDGNYILWQGDMTAFGPLPLLNDTLVQIGGIALMPHEAKEEQDGKVNRPLPTATDERFIMEEPAASTEQVEEAEAVIDGEGQAPASEEPTEAEGEGDADPEPTDEEQPEAEAPAEAESEETETDNPKTE